MKLLRDAIEAIRHLGDAIFALSEALLWSDYTKCCSSDEKFQELVQKIYSEDAREEEIPLVEEEIPHPTAEIVEFSLEAQDFAALREEMLDYLRERGVVVDGKTPAEVELEVARRLGIPRSALNLGIEG